MNTVITIAIITVILSQPNLNTALGIQGKYHQRIVTLARRSLYRKY